MSVTGSLPLLGRDTACTQHGIETKYTYVHSKNASAHILCVVFWMVYMHVLKQHLCTCDTWSVYILRRKSSKTTWAMDAGQQATPWSYILWRKSSHCTCQTNKWNNMCPVLICIGTWPLTPKLYSAMILTLCTKRTCSHSWFEWLHEVR